MVKYQYKDDKWGPVLFCDVCGHRIMDTTTGAVLTKSPIGGEGIVDENKMILDLLHVHKGPCLDVAEKLPNVKAGWEELSHHLLHLMYNVRFPPEKMIELRAMINDVF